MSVTRDQIKVIGIQSGVSVGIAAMAVATALYIAKPREELGILAARFDGVAQNVGTLTARIETLSGKLDAISAISMGERADLEARIRLLERDVARLEVVEERDK